MNESKRIEVIDVLRGFALLGILIVHASGEFAGWSGSYNNPQQASVLYTASLDSATNFIVTLLFTGKARALFAFLFGVGFYFQLGKASRRGYRIESRFAKRMFFLLLIGAMHAYFIWAGDILRLYAVCGFLLLPVYKWKPKTLFLLAGISTIIIPALASGIHIYLPSSALSSDAKRVMYEGYAGNDYPDLFKANLLRDASVMSDPYSIGIYLFPIWGNFLFGFVAVQTGFIQKLTGNKTFLLRCILMSGITGLLLSSSFTKLVLKLFHTNESNIGLAWRSLLSLPSFYSIEATAFFLMCVVTYLFTYTVNKKWLSLFTYAGRMTLTNYIMQSAFAVIFFFGAGFGFISHFGAFIALCIGLLFFVLQLMYSFLWLHHFTVGPIEYIWRSLIEGEWKTIKKSKLITG